MRVTLLKNRKKIEIFFSARHNSMTKLCRALFKCENKPKLVEKITYNFVVHSNDSACRKSGCLGLDQVNNYGALSNDHCTYENVICLIGSPKRDNDNISDDPDPANYGQSDDYNPSCCFPNDNIYYTPTKNYVQYDDRDPKYHTTNGSNEDLTNDGRNNDRDSSNEKDRLFNRMPPNPHDNSQFQHHKSIPSPHRFYCNLLLRAAVGGIST